uniref:Uncharacterized protein n=1 Tax=Oryza rufipogon TaxID=4529 RepID=A0A0E0PX30_ORYRU
RGSGGSAAAGASRARRGRAAQHPEQPPETWIEVEEAPARESSDESSSSSFSGSRSGAQGADPLPAARLLPTSRELRPSRGCSRRTPHCCTREHREHGRRSWWARTCFNPFANKKKKRCRKQLTWGIPWIILDLISSTRDKYNEEEPNAFDLFKEFHYSKKKKCYTTSVQEAIVR